MLTDLKTGAPYYAPLFNGSIVQIEGHLTHSKQFEAAAAAQLGVGVAFGQVAHGLAAGVSQLACLGALARL
jgi:hypothetical protein